MSTAHHREDEPSGQSTPSDEQALLQLVEEVAAELHAGRHRAARTRQPSSRTTWGSTALARTGAAAADPATVRRDAARAGDRSGAETPRRASRGAAGARQAGAPARRRPPPTRAAPLSDRGAGGPPPRDGDAGRRPRLVRASERRSSSHRALSSPMTRPLPSRYGELLAMPRRLAAGSPRETSRAARAVALMLPTGRDFFVAFLGIQLAGGVPVPIYPPFRASQLEDHLRRQALILENARAVLLIGSAETARAAAGCGAGWSTLRAVVTVAELSRVRRRADALRRVRRTWRSSSTPPAARAIPRASCSPTRTCSRTCARSARRWTIQPTDVVVSWLPLYHDMGLIGAWLGSLYLRLSPGGDAADAVPRPAGGLAAGDAPPPRHARRRRPTSPTRSAPAGSPDADLAGLDLGAWRLA